MKWWEKILGGSETPGKPWECTVDYEDGSQGRYQFFAVTVRDAIANVLSHMPTQKDIGATEVLLKRRMDWEDK
jgi:hypothetical protein